MKLLFTILIVGLCFCCENPPPNKTETLLYLSVRDKDYNIFINDLNGNEQQLTTNPGFDYAPMWNESLESIIYYSYERDSFLIGNMSLDGVNLKIETYGQQEFNLSPDAKYLIHQVNLEDYSSLVLTTVQGALVDTISDNRSYNGRAKWSRQSNQIAYISDREGNNEVYLFNLDTKQTTRITNNSSFEKYLAWSPDGTQLAYTTQYYKEGKADRNDIFTSIWNVGFQLKLRTMNSMILN